MPHTSTFVELEIASQPASWRRAVALAAGGHRALPAAGARVAIVGCGTSSFIAQAFAVAREAAGQGETDWWAGSEFGWTRSYDAVILLSRSGTTTEILAARTRIPAGVPVIAILADPNTPLFAAVDQAIVLDFADEQSVVQTRFATTALALLLTHIGVSLERAIVDVEAALADPVPAQWLAKQQFVFLGTGWTQGLAAEAALKVREASQSWAESYQAMEYRHGPLSVAEERTLVWVFGEPPAGLIDDLAVTGALVRSSDLHPLADLVLAQRLAVALAEQKGLNPDAPRNLTRAVHLA